MGKVINNIRIGMFIKQTHNDYETIYQVVKLKPDKNYPNYRNKQNNYYLIKVIHDYIKPEHEEHYDKYEGVLINWYIPVGKNENHVQDNYEEIEQKEVVLEVM